MNDIQDKRLIKIRKAVLEDIPQILECSKTTNRFRMSVYTNSIDSDEINFWIRDSRTIVLVVVIAKRIIGYAYGFIISPKWFFFDEFLIIPEYQNKGIGKMLYKHLRNDCISKGLHLIQGLVKDTKESSLKYWLDLGYEKGKKCIWVEDWLDEE